MSYVCTCQDDYVIHEDRQDACADCVPVDRVRDALLAIGHLRAQIRDLERDLDEAQRWRDE